MIFKCLHFQKNFPTEMISLVQKYMTYNVFLKHKTIHKARQWPKLMIFFVMFNERAGGFYRGIKPRARGEAELLYTR